jgi:uncharacterized protein YfaS (alpha-2-macroglobulin family)
MIPTDMKPGEISDERLWDIIKRCELTEEEERKVQSHCVQRGIIYLSTPFSRAAADRLMSMNLPAFKIGYAALRIETKDKELKVQLKTDKDRYGPREKVTVTIKTTDADGKPVPAELSLGVVDLSLLALSGFDKPDLVSIFYSQRGLGVYTSQMLSQLVERFKPGSKGGGGGTDPETVKRGDFKDTAHWLPSVVTDASGTATVTFTLPDNLTTWQLLSIGSTMQNTFGADVMTILETKKGCTPICGPMILGSVAPVLANARYC